MEFVNDGEKLRVISHSELAVTLLGLKLFDFNQQVEEGARRRQDHVP